MSKKKKKKQKEEMKKMEYKQIKKEKAEFSEEIKVASRVRLYGRMTVLFFIASLAGFLLSDFFSSRSEVNTNVISATSLYAATNKEAVATTTSHIYFFGREDCHFCQAEKKFLSGYLPSHPEIALEYYDIVKDPKAKELFLKIISANGLPHVTPLTLVGGQVIQGFESDITTGKDIIDGVKGKDFSVSAYETKVGLIKSTSGCDENGKECGIVGPGTTNLVFNIPFIGTTDLKDFSLFSLSAILGFIDGFNPCALWVLITFLLALMQVGSRKKMFYVAGLFLLAEAIMYYAILTAWYKTWDFVGLDQVVTPLIGVLSLGSGLFFLYRWKKAKDTVTCDITDIEEQEKISGKIYKLANAPLTIATALGIMGIALSVNIIEFACSIGIPQVFTKTLELNVLSFWQYQGYLFIYMLGYMADDIVVFAFALYGINKIHESEKYSKLSLLIGGILMLLLGIMLVFFPNILVL